MKSAPASDPPAIVQPAPAPIMTTAIAPTAAPPETPRMYGSANGFRSRTWNTAPAMESIPPTRAARATRGRRTSRRIVAATGSPASPPSREATSATLTGTAPHERARQDREEESEDGRDPEDDSAHRPGFSENADG